MPENNYKSSIKEQCSESEPVEIKVNILSEGGRIWIQPDGFGEKCAMDGQGYPVGIEIWQGKLRLIVFDDINSEEAKIIDLENARESRRHEYCQAAEYLAEQGRTVFLGHTIGGIWNGACITASFISKDICINGSKPLPQFERGDKGAYEYLLKIADEYSPCLTDEQRKVLEGIKKNAAAFLKSSELSSNVTDGQESEITYRCNWCGELMKTEPIRWKGLPFCSEQCLDECRVAQ